MVAVITYNIIVYYTCTKPKCSGDLFEEDQLAQCKAMVIHKIIV